MPDINEHDFKHCLGKFATGVTVATTKTPNSNLHGVTVNSFTSVSLNPPMILFCLEKNAFSYHNFIESEFFAINILNEQQEDISRQFASPAKVIWDNIVYEEATTGAPILDGVIAYIECLVDKIHDGGDHSILVGKIINLKKTSDNKPLLYFSGQYKKLGDSE